MAVFGVTKHILLNLFLVKNRGPSRKGSRKIARSRPGRGSTQNFAAVLMEGTVSFFEETGCCFCPRGRAAWLVKALKSPGVDTRHETRDRIQETQDTRHETRDNFQTIFGQVADDVRTCLENSQICFRYFLDSFRIIFREFSDNFQRFLYNVQRNFGWF